MSAWEKGSVGAVKATICKDSLQWEIPAWWKWPRSQGLGCCLAALPGIRSYKCLWSAHAPNSEWLRSVRGCKDGAPGSTPAVPLPSWASSVWAGAALPDRTWGWHWLRGTSTGQEWRGFCWRIQYLTGACCLIAVLINTFAYYQRQSEKSGKGTSVVNGFCLA